MSDRRQTKGVPYQWFVAHLLFECRAGISDAGIDWEEQIRLIRAASAELAFERATKRGLREQTSYQNEQGETIRWIFLGLLELDELEAERIADGIEISSRRTREKLSPVEKDRLAVFWSATRRNQTASDILDELPASRRLPRREI